MLLKCTCSHCSNHLEFESEHVGTVITCPVCAKPTKLFMQDKYSLGAPGAASASPARVPTSGSSAEPAAATLQAVRANTCYRTFRLLIKALHGLLLAFAGLMALGAIFQFFMLSGAMESFGGQNMTRFPAFMLLAAGLLMAAFAGIGAFITKHALLALADIADCQIQQCARGK